MGILFFVLILLIVQALALPVLPREVQAWDRGDIAINVDIPDTNLRAALREACNKPPFILDQTPLTNQDLAKLTGTLLLEKKGIKDLEGIQYCINITQLKVYGNPLTSFPDMQYMEGLTYLWLVDCQLKEIPPAVATIPHLIRLDLSRNQISSIPPGLGFPSLTDIDLHGNKFTVFPDALLGYKTLQYIVLRENSLKSLPDALGKMPNLARLFVDLNKLTSLPASLGTGKIEVLGVSGNQLTSLPNSIASSKTLQYLDVSANCLRQLPDGIADSQCPYIDLSFNYLDISEGSKTLQLIKKISAHTKYYEDQLIPVRNLKATPGKDQIKVTWDPCPDVIGDPNNQGFVSHYDVYLKENNKLSLLGSVQKSASPSYIDAGLAPGAKRDYSIAVIYEVDGFQGSAVSQFHSTISGEIPKEETTTTTTAETTSAEPDTTAVATTSPGEAPTSDLIMTAAGSEVTQESGGGIDSPDEHDKVQNTAYLKWIILALVLVLIAGALLVWFLLIRPRRKKG